MFIIKQHFWAEFQLPSKKIASNQNYIGERTSFKQVINFFFFLFIKYGLKRKNIFEY